MNKNFFKISLTLNIVFAVISGISWFVFNHFSTLYRGTAFLAFISYTRLLFDLLPVFVGYATIIFAFSKLDFKNGLISLGTFSSSVAISFIVQVIGRCIEHGASFSITIIYIAAGSCFINQLIPAILIALLTFKLTKNKKNLEITKLVSWSNPVQKTMMITSFVLCGVNVIAITALDLFPLLIKYNFSFLKSDFISLVTTYVADYTITILFYLVLQYVVYYWMYKFYCNYIKAHPERN